MILSWRKATPSGVIIVWLKRLFWKESELLLSGTTSGSAESPHRRSLGKGRAPWSRLAESHQIFGLGLWLNRFWHFDVDVAAKRADHSWADGQEDCLLREEYGQYKLGGWEDWLYSQSQIEIIPQQNMIRADKSTDDQVLTVKKADRAADTGTYRIKLTCEGGR